MSTWIDVGSINEFTEGSMKEVSVKGREILLIKVQGNYYASDNRCPHMGGRLSQGRLEGVVVTCPRHGSQFNVADGRVVRWLKGAGLLTALGKMFKSPRPINSYAVHLEDDRVKVEIPD
jgi:3-phenylpropionate/trans-cinnamate dioxygenase ferredoxin subunit